MKNMTHFCKSLALIAVLGIIPVRGSLAQEYRSRPDGFAELEREIGEILTDHGVPGAALALVSRDERIWVGGMGYSDVSAKKPVTASSIFRWGSVSKSFVSVAVQILVERGSLDLDDRIHDLVPEIEFENRWESTDPVRLVHCLEHTTGFDDLHFNDCAVDNPTIALVDALAINPNSRRSRWRPGTYKSYCNVGPAIAAHVVADVSGLTFEEFLEEHVFDPLEMKTSSFYYPETAELMAKGYEEDGATEVAYDHIALRPAGSLNSSPEEMARFVQMLLSRGEFEGTRILDPESVRRMETPATTLAARAGYSLGYGLGNYTTLRNGYTFHGHDGMVAGFVASYGYDPALGMGYAISINKIDDRALQRIIDAIIEYLAADTVGPSARGIEISDEDIRTLTGYYQSATPMTQLMHTLLLRFVNIRRVTARNGILYSGNFLFGKQRELVPISRNAFHREYSNESLVFIEDGGDMMISYDSLRGNFVKAPGWLIYIRFGAFVLCLSAMITSLAFALFWVPRRLLGRLREERHLKARLFPLLSAIFFFVTYLSLANGLMKIELDKALMARLGTLNSYSIAIFLSSICFALFSILGFFYSLRALPEKSNRSAHVHSLLVSIFNVTAAVYLWFGDVVGIMTWSY